MARVLGSPSLHPDFHVIIGALTSEAGMSAVSLLQSEDSSRSLSTVPIDLTSDASIAEAAEWVSQTFGRCDVLCNNAGVMLERLDGAITTRKLFESTYHVNVFGSAAVTEAFIPLLEKSTSAAPRIVFISSGMGSLATKAMPNEPSAKTMLPIYRSSKSASNMLMLHYAAVCGARGWKVNSADPGLTRTELTTHEGAVLPGGGSIEDGTMAALRLATLGPDGENGTFQSKEGVVPW